MNGDQLVRMINDISGFFVSESDQNEAVEGVVGHITKFWDPRMRSQIVSHVAQTDGAGLTELSRLAVNRLGEK
ncbi:MAG: formate dehydrogenase subunit delta [Betaproteobacteria bacterium]|jgi:formate dehydrogenase subunit delta